jgi:tripartite-type tricarboxylate transporter receptor subunit TctC
VRFIVPFGRDGASDRAARTFAASMSRRLGGDAGISIENLPGEGGRLGVVCANAIAEQGKPVLMLGTPTTHVLLPMRHGNDASPHTALRPWVGLGSAPNVLLVSPKLGVLTLEALLVRARRETLTYASAGIGQTIHVCSALLCEEAGITMRHMPYAQGSALAYGDLWAGKVDAYFDNLLGCRDRIEQGDAVPVAVSSRTRHPLLPGVPTLAECGFPNHALDVWLGVFVANVDNASAEFDAMQLATDLAALGLAGGPTGGVAFSAQVLASRPLWLRACDAVEAK